ncbi:MAG: hypothetical protein M0Q21_11825 [Ignavibacteriaceae bacterium]|nr:hypothetical protein [Ignavibacteriaceae bacterium]
MKFATANIALVQIADGGSLMVDGSKRFYISPERALYISIWAKPYAEK